jgi:transcription elongation factor Elf1
LNFLERLSYTLYRRHDMTKRETFTCPECDHAHDCEVITGETKWDDYSEVPERCEACGVEFSDDCTANGPSERQQMGICY